MSEFQKLGEEEIYDGKIIRVGVETFRHADGSEVEREKVWHPGAVGMLAIGDEHVWLVRQPREAIGSSDSLEIPAGKLDVPGEEPLATAKRELEEEIGKRAESWEEIKAFFESLGSGGAIVIKAMAGGGGRGMRVVEKAADLAEAYARCQSEAKAAFGFDGVYAERLIRKARLENRLIFRR